METITVVLAMLAAVVISGVLTRMLPVTVPTPLVQIVLGAVIAAFSQQAVKLEPEIFFLLFLPPLLFLGGWRIPNEGLWRQIGLILQLAFGLVIVTVLGMGLFIHWLIPTLPLPVAFALAAIISPTDPVALSGITGRISIPRRLLHVLEGESLFNDASGLVCFRFAVAAAVSGTFSLSSAAMTFSQLAAGGLVIGIGMTFLIVTGKTIVCARFGEEPGAQVLVSLLIPFAAYLVAEHLHASGILAVVSAGIVMSYLELSGRALGATRMQRTAVWDTVQLTLNGVMFVLLGEQLPQILANAATAVRQSEHVNPAWLIVYVVAINLGLALLRVIFVVISMEVTSLMARRRGHASKRLSRRAVGAMSVAGVRGAITLAGVLTLPLTLPDGTPFPARDLAVFLAAGTIIGSLLCANLFLPMLLRGVTAPEGPAHRQAVDRARSRAAEAAIAAVETALHDSAEGSADADLYAHGAARTMELYRHRLEGMQEARDGSADSKRRAIRAEYELRLIAVKAERDTLFALARAQELSDEESRRLIRDLDLLEERLRHMHRQSLTRPQGPDAA